jgi:V-type H+-transporting ATPase proteolipid subunit
MSGIIAVYALVISVLIAQDLTAPGSGSTYTLFSSVCPSLHSTEKYH